MSLLCTLSRLPAFNNNGKLCNSSILGFLPTVSKQGIKNASLLLGKSLRFLQKIIEALAKGHEGLPCRIIALSNTAWVASAAFPGHTAVVIPCNEKGKSAPAASPAAAQPFPEKLPKIRSRRLRGGRAY